MDNVTELINVGGLLGIDCCALNKSDAIKLINLVIKKHNPLKITDHLGIGHDSYSLSLDEYEYEYSKYLANEEAYIFFDQAGSNRNSVVVVSDARRICDLMSNTYGMEYFVTNKNMEYLIVVNWYVIEILGLKVLECKVQTGC